MSFDLPRNAKGLRFTGNVKALAEPDGPPARSGPPESLGKPRPRAIPSPPPSAQPSALDTPPRSVPPPSRKDVYKADLVPTPYLAPKIITPVPNPNPNPKPIEEVSYEDDVKTMGFDREGLDLMPGGAFKVTRPQTPMRPIAPIPNFRPAIVQPQIVTPQKKVERKKASGAPLALWILASIVAGILSYRLAPEAMDRAGIVLERR